MTKFMALIFATFGAVSVHAAESAAGSEYMHQAPIGKFELTPLLGYTTLKYDLVTKSPSGADVKGWIEAVTLEYGLSEDLSANLKLSTGSLSTSYSGGSFRTIKASGMYDPEVNLKGKYLMGSMAVRYGLAATFALSKSIEEANGDTNNASGGMEAAPFVGIEMYSGNMTMGAKLLRSFNLAEKKIEDKSTTPSTEKTATGGETTSLDGFFEMQASPQMLFGGSLSFSATDRSETKTKSTNSTSKSAGSTLATLTGYGAFKATESISILPSLTYVKDIAVDNTSIDSISGWMVGVGGRFAF